MWIYPTIFRTNSIVLISFTCRLLALNFMHEIKETSYVSGSQAVNCHLLVNVFCNHCFWSCHFVWTFILLCYLWHNIVITHGVWLHWLLRLLRLYIFRCPLVEMEEGEIFLNTCFRTWLIVAPYLFYRCQESLLTCFLQTDSHHAHKTHGDMWLSSFCATVPSWYNLTFPVSGYRFLSGWLLSAWHGQRTMATITRLDGVTPVVKLESV